jgi:hypothetical protein
MALSRILLGGPQVSSQNERFDKLIKTCYFLTQKYHKKTM